MSIKSIFSFLCLLCSLGPVHAQWIGGGRSDAKGFATEIYGGLGTLRDVEGTVGENKEDDFLPGGLTVNFSELGLKDDGHSLILGGKLKGKWLTFFMDYRQSSAKGSGVAQQEFRFSVSGITFEGQELGYLLVPVDTTYTIEAESLWFGGGFRITPLTLNPEGRLRFSPWLHLGLQYTDYEYTIDAGSVASVEFEGETRRLFARQGRGTNRERAVIPEYGFGGELRFDFNPADPNSIQIVAETTFKFLDFQSSMSRLRLRADNFEGIEFTYKAIESNLYGIFPLGDRVDFLAGIYLEQVEIDYTLTGERRFAGLNRDVTLEYTILGARVGFRF
ncbi:MAG: hypothetical protein JJU29_00195 [Verrucomicrobia bacterium]|nr:hypothetical protein [Verrucomicrobiota bacterium]